MKLILVAVLSGSFVAALITAARILISGMSPPMMSLLILLDSLSYVGPGLVAGWIAARSPWAMGLLIGIGAYLVSGMLVPGLWFTGEVISTSVLVMCSVITQTVAAIAGVALRSRRPPSNNSFKPNLLRSSKRRLQKA